MLANVLKLAGAEVSIRHGSRLLIAVCAILAALALALNEPGQVSMDTSVQLFEAQLGHSVSWNPPLMSALLRWLGGGEVGSALFVLLNVSLLYGSFALLIAGQLSEGKCGRHTISIWRLFLGGLLLLNPVVFVYSGIVWKDVLFASSVAGVISTLSLAVSANGVWHRWLAALLAIAILSLATLVRQQGLVLAVPLFAAVAVCVLSPHKKHAGLQLLAVAAGFALCVGVLAAATAGAISRANDRGFSVGFQNIFNYDIAGVVYEVETGPNPGDLNTVPKSVRDAILQSYSPYRIDFLSNNPVFSQWSSQLGPQGRLSLWARTISRFPLAYVKHRLNVFAALLGVYGVEKCLPVHVGVAGNQEYLKDVGLVEGTNARSQLLYRIESPLFKTPLFWHWFESAWLAILLVVIAVSRTPARKKFAMSMTAISGLLLLASYLPTSIACDYRYLFCLVPVATLVSLWVVLMPAPTQKVPEEQR